MPNKNGPRGLVPVRHPSGDIRRNAYTIASAYDTNIWTGDPVETTGTGMNIALAAAANADNRGVFVGCEYTPTTGPTAGRPQFSPYWPADTVAKDITAFVVDDPNVVFMIQALTIAEADVGQLADWVIGAGSITVGGASGTYLSSTYGATGGSLRVIGLVPDQEQEYGAYANVLVTFAEHVGLGVVSGVGGN